MALVRRPRALSSAAKPAPVLLVGQAARHQAWGNLKSGDFAAALTAIAVCRTPHFVLHHLAAEPASCATRPNGRPAIELSTDDAPKHDPSVDNSIPPRHWWLGLVVPKRHARRSVTRSLLKHQMRAQADLHQSQLPRGQWVLRLRAPFDPRRYPSAASPALRQAARGELAQIFADAVAA